MDKGPEGRGVRFELRLFREHVDTWYAGTQKKKRKPKKIRNIVEGHHHPYPTRILFRVQFRLDDQPHIQKICIAMFCCFGLALFTRKRVNPAPLQIPIPPVSFLSFPPSFYFFCTLYEGGPQDCIDFHRTHPPTMAQYAGLSLREIYAVKCDDLHCKKNSGLLKILPDKAGHFEDLETLDLGTNFVGPKGLLPVLEVVGVCVNLHTFSLKDNQLTNQSVCDVCDFAAQHPSLTSLDFSDNPITLSAGKALLQLANLNPRIRAITLDGTNIRPMVARSIANQCQKNKEQVLHTLTPGLSLRIQFRSSFSLLLHIPLALYGSWWLTDGSLVVSRQLWQLFRSSERRCGNATPGLRPPSAACPATPTTVSSGGPPLVHRAARRSPSRRVRSVPHLDPLGGPGRTGSSTMGHWNFTWRIAHDRN